MSEPIRRCIHLLTCYELQLPVPGRRHPLTLPELHRLWRAILSEEL